MMMSSHARLERATREVEYWRSRKAERIKLMDKVQAEMNRLQGLLGQQPNSSLAGVIDINDATLEMMREEVERLKGAQVERTGRLAEKIRELQELCAVMSEDHSVLLRDVSPAVAAFRCALSANRTSFEGSPYCFR
jgi:DNA anti-recombination protein RmuC